MEAHTNYVSNGATLKCMFGSSQPKLTVIRPTINIGGNNMATIMDFAPMMNIMPFGQCKSMANPTVAAATAANYGKLQEMPCIPATTAPWIPGLPTVMVGKLPALTKDSKCMCMWAGMIEITDSGVK
jgi:hypothetical protein